MKQIYADEEIPNKFSPLHLISLCLGVLVVKFFSFFSLFRASVVNEEYRHGGRRYRRVPRVLLGGAAIEARVPVPFKALYST